MRRAETIILLTILLVGVAAFILERLGPDAVRLIAIGFCCFLLLLVAIGLVLRLRLKRKSPLPGIPQDPVPIKGDAPRP